MWCTRVFSVTVYTRRNVIKVSLRVVAIDDSDYERVELKFPNGGNLRYLIRYKISLPGCNVSLPDAKTGYLGSE